MDFVCFRHLGIPCAIPADQAWSAEMGDTELKLTTLWKPRPGGVDGDRFLKIELPEGPRAIKCSRLGVRAVSSRRRIRLSPLIRAAIDLPHVVGLLQIDDSEVAWLIDLGEYSGPAPKPVRASKAD